MAVDFQDMTIDEPRLKISGNRNNRRRSKPGTVTSSIKTVSMTTKRLRESLGNQIRLGPWFLSGLISLSLDRIMMRKVTLPRFHVAACAQQSHSQLKSCDCRPRLRLSDESNYYRSCVL